MRAIIAKAARAPSGDNTQPWSFTWQDQTLTIVFNPTKAVHVLDAGLSAAKISLGCVMESVAIAASEYGFATRAEYLDFGGEDLTAARVAFLNDGTKPDPLVDAIATRNTDRRVFKKGPMPTPELTEVLQNFDESAGVGVHWVDSLGPDLFQYIVAAESLVSNHPKIFPDTVKWIRFSEQEIKRTQDGMPWRGAGINVFQYPAMRFLRAVPSAFPWLSRAGMKQVYAARMRRLLRSSAGLFCISTSRHDSLALVDVGRLAMRVWLRLTQLGYGVQPLTISSLSLYNAKIGVLDAESVRLFGKRYEEGERILRRAFRIPPDSFPVWMFRTGLSSPLPSAWFTQRKEALTHADAT